MQKSNRNTRFLLKYKIKLKSFPYFQLIFLTLHAISEKWALFMAVNYLLDLDN